ncbi:MAG: hypothetical protein MJK14_25480 [Rivularia sp. ALOHA_DT_140]|nr:hypothetical protein [Rivularia sp. ALOHA_DT_140]
MNSTPFVTILIYIVLQTLFNLVVRILLIIGSIIVVKRVRRWYGWCLLIGSTVFLLSYIPVAPIFSFILVRILSPQQFAQISIAGRIFTSLALLVFSIGFIGLSRQFNRKKSGD